MTKKLKVAIVHDWLTGGGAEKVVLALHQMFPDAPIYTSYSTPEWRTRLDDKVVTGYLGKAPFSKIKKFIPMLRASWFSNLDLSEYDLVISSSGAEAKGLKTGPNTIHINYCHAPTHYYWSRYDEYITNPGFGKFDPVARIGLKALVGPMRRWDYKAAKRPDYIVANSNYTKSQIKKYYDRDATVINPPVDVNKFIQKSGSLERKGFVIAARQTPYKRVDLAVIACSKLGLPLRVVGNGPDHARLVSLAGPTIEFLTNVSDADLAKYFQTAEAFIFPGIDDFGIAPVEAMAAGTPVIAYNAGGALDYVEEHKTGVFFNEQNADSLEAALKKFKKIKWDHKAVVNKAVQFKPEVFKVGIRELIDKALAKQNHKIGH